MVVVGLDASGKSTLINYLKPQKVRAACARIPACSRPLARRHLPQCVAHRQVEPVPTALPTTPHHPTQLASYEVTPTVGFSQESFEKGKLRFTVFDMAGGGAYRSLWEAYYRDVDAIIFVVDSSDRIRMAVAKDELDALLAHADVRRGTAPILVFANKMDVRGAMEPPDISATLALHRITDRAWQIQASNALTGDGVEAGVAWLATQLTSATGGGGSAPKPKAGPTPLPEGAAAASGGGGGGGGAVGGAGAAP